MAPPPFSWDDFCASFPSEAPWLTTAAATAAASSDGRIITYDDSARDFLNGLQLPWIHPVCLSHLNNNNNSSSIPWPPGIPPMGPLTDPTHHETFLHALVTLFWQLFPALMAMGELWLRLFASAIAPLGICHLIYKQLQWSNDNNNNDSSSKSKIQSKNKDAATKSKQSQQSKQQIWLAVSCILTIASSVVLMTDSNYVYQYDGHGYGASLLILSTILVIRTISFSKRSTAANETSSSSLSLRWLYFVLVMLWILALYLTIDGSGNFPHDRMDIPNVEEGFYYSKKSKEETSSVARLLTRHWPASSRVYSPETGATPWTPTGDARTGIPFLINKAPDIAHFERLWVTNEWDGEAVALMFAFPQDKSCSSNSSSDDSSSSSASAPCTYVHSADKPMYLILHGLNGGTQEEFVREFTERRNREGSTVAVMVARGLMDTPVRGWDIFHGARVTDVASTTMALKRAKGGEGTFLAGVGYSMGAIILGNYVARFGKECALDAAFAIAGGLDMRQQMRFPRGQRLWQPLLVQELRDTFMIGKFGNRAKKRLTNHQMLQLMRAASVQVVDMYAVVAYHDFDDLTHYYTEMSAMGDYVNSTHVGRIANVSIPFCVLHALDDPLITWRAVAAVDPNELVETGSGNLMILLTKAGGHVGWPLGWNPRVRGWEFMNNAAKDFVEAVRAANKEQQQLLKQQQQYQQPQQQEED